MVVDSYKKSISILILLFVVGCTDPQTKAQIQKTKDQIQIIKTLQIELRQNVANWCQERDINSSGCLPSFSAYLSSYKSRYKGLVDEIKTKNDLVFEAREITTLIDGIQTLVSKIQLKQSQWLPKIQSFKENKDWIIALKNKDTPENIKKFKDPRDLQGAVTKFYKSGIFKLYLKIEQFTDLKFVSSEADLTSLISSNVKPFDANGLNLICDGNVQWNIYLDDEEWRKTYSEIIQADEKFFLRVPLSEGNFNNEHIYFYKNKNHGSYWEDSLHYRERRKSDVLMREDTVLIKYPRPFGGFAESIRHDFCYPLSVGGGCYFYSTASEYQVFWGNRTIKNKISTSLMGYKEKLFTDNVSRTVVGRDTQYTPRYSYADNRSYKYDNASTLIIDKSELSMTDDFKREVNNWFKKSFVRNNKYVCESLTVEEYKNALNQETILFEKQNVSNYLCDFKSEEGSIITRPCSNGSSLRDGFTTYYKY